MREYEVLYETIEDGWIMATVPDLPGTVIQSNQPQHAAGLLIRNFEIQ